MSRYPWKAVLITGASSGLGRALAEVSAAPGITLHLSGRAAARLEDTAASCRARGATVAARVLSVTDASAMAAWIAGAGRLDLVIANAGISGGTGDAVETAGQVLRIFATNLGGVLNTALPAIAAMAAQAPGADGWRGRVAVVASLAAFVASPSAPAYCASKAAVQRWAEAQDASERKRGIRLHAICPGFIRTPMTARNPFAMPGLMTPEQAARRMLDGIAQGRVRVAYPWRLYAASRMVGALPPAWRNALMGRIAPKPPAD